MLQSLLPRSSSALSAASRSTRALPCLNARSSRRHYALQAADATDPKLSAIDPAQLTITRATTPKDLLPNEELVFGRTFTGQLCTLPWLLNRTNKG